MFSLLCEKYILSLEAPTERLSLFGPCRLSVALTGGIAEQETAYVIILGIEDIPSRLTHVSAGEFQDVDTWKDTWISNVFGDSQTS